MLQPLILVFYLLHSCHLSARSLLSISLWAVTQMKLASTPVLFIPCSICALSTDWSCLMVTSALLETDTGTLAGLTSYTQLLYQEWWPLAIHRDLLSQRQGEIFPFHPERLDLYALAWPMSWVVQLKKIIETIQHAGAPTVRSLYKRKLLVFEKWCSDMQIICFQCSVAIILAFLHQRWIREIIFFF